MTSLAPVFPVTMTYLDVFCSVRETETERQRQRDTETERQRQREREREQFCCSECCIWIISGFDSNVYKKQKEFINGYNNYA